MDPKCLRACMFSTGWVINSIVFTEIRIDDPLSGLCTSSPHALRADTKGMVATAQFRQSEGQRQSNMQRPVLDIFHHVQNPDQRLGILACNQWGIQACSDPGILACGPGILA